jgi:hypothetical protein
MTTPNPLTDNALWAAACFAVGVTSEGGIAGFSGGDACTVRGAVFAYRVCGR